MSADSARDMRTGREIAVVGIACRFPHAHGPDALWKLLTRGEHTFDTLDDAELRAAGLSESALAASGYVRVASRVDGYDRFDAEFFGYTSKQAAEIDPQQRLFLECAWEALENAGCDPSRFAGSIGVMAGSGINRYSLHSLYRSVADADFIETVKQTLNADKDYLCTRVSYKLDLRGPSIAVQTACSTSLVAVHMAAASLNSREADMMLAGGVTIHVPHGVGYRHNEGSIFSPDGRCRVFDADAKGTVPGSGCGVVALRRLDDAIRDGNHIYGVIVSSAINNDGADKLGFAAPSVAGQEDVIRTALGSIAPDSIGMIEAHGTGTTLGDSIELSALSNVFTSADEPTRAAPCVLGSIKSNIGHLDTASGIAGLIKALLCLRHAAFVPTLHAARPNAMLAPGGPFSLGDAYRAWPRDGAPRRACVSSFGMGGTNCHVVLQEAAETEQVPNSRCGYVFPLSAKTPAALVARRADLAAAIRCNPMLSARDVAYTLQHGRKAFDHRVAYVARDGDALLKQLDVVSSDVASVTYTSARLLFDDALPLGPWAPRLLQLRESEDALPGDVDRCLAAVLGMRGKAPEVIDAVVLERALDGPMARLIAQYCTARKLLAAGIRVDAMHGSGGGALSAACVSGMLGVADAIHQLAQLQRGDEPAPLPRTVAVALSSVPCLDAGGTAEWMPADLRSLTFWRACSNAGATAYVDAMACVPDDTMALRIDSLGGAHDERFPITPVSTPLELVARAWACGVPIDWPPGSEDNMARIVALPTYPFERKRHWLDDDRVSVTTSSASPGVAAVGFWFPVWSATAPPAPPAPQCLTAEGERWLVLCDSLGVGAAVAARLRNDAPDVTNVHAAAHCETEDRRFDPKQPNRHIALLQALRDAGQRPTRIVHCGLVNPASDSASRAEECPRDCESGYLDVLQLIQAWECVFPDYRLGLTVIGSGIAVGPWDGVAPYKAALPSLALIAAQEVPHFDMRIIDIPAQPSGMHHGASDYSAWMLADALASDPRSLIAYRGRCRYVSGWQPIESNDSEIPVREIRRNGTYLVTGGLGGVGLELAQSLAQEFAARLVLTTRNAFPEQEAWDGIVADANTPRATVERIRALRRIEQSGGEVLVVTADVADASSLAAALDASKTRFGRVNGVFHLAGATNDASVYVPLRALDRTHIDAQARPKVLGLLNLRHVLADTHVDFVVAFSSNSASLGGVGFGAYAAANAAMDSIVASLPQGDVQKWLSIAWDGWATGGMPARSPATISAPDALRALWTIFPYMTVPHVVVSKHDMSALPAISAAVGAGEAQRESSGVELSRKAITAPYVAPRNELERMVVTVWESVLGIAPIGVDDNCLELGADSLVLLDIIERAKMQFHVTVPLRTLLSAEPTVATFAAQIEIEMIKRIKDLDLAARETES